MKKQTGNRLLSIVLSLAMLLSLFPTMALTASAEITTSIENGVLTISGDGAIDDDAFSYNSDITSVIIGDGITSIGECAFESCTNLKSVTIGNGVTSIGEEAFYRCESLESVTIGSGVTLIDYFAFEYCTSLESVTFVRPDEAHDLVIEYGAFYNVPGTLSYDGDNGFVLYNTDSDEYVAADANLDDLNDGSFTWEIPVTKYSVTWKNYNGSVLKKEKVAEGVTPSYTGSTPTKYADAQYVYTFSGWSPELAPATADVTYTAQFTASPLPANYAYPALSGLWVGDSDEVTEAGVVSGTGAAGTATVSQEGDYTVLTLDNFLYSGAGHNDNNNIAPTAATIYYSNTAPLIIRLIGTNELEHTGISTGTSGNSNGIYTFHTNDVIIEGAASLTVSSGDAPSNSKGILINGGNLGISESTVNAYGASVTNYACDAIDVEDCIIKNGAKLTAVSGSTAGKGTGVMTFSHSSGCHNLVVESGSASLSGTRSAIYYGGADYRAYLVVADGSTLKVLKAGDSEAGAADVELDAITDQKYIYVEVERAPAHTHAFTYTADGATVTASCNGAGTCDVTEGRTLTISAPEGDLTADGTTTFPAKLNDDYNTTAFPGEYSITYTKNGEPFDGVPTEAGAYTASVTVGEGENAVTASVNYTVLSAVASVTSGETTTDYSNFATALENWVDGSTLTLLKDVETTSTITVSSDTRTFDLNDYSITLTGTGSVFYVTGGNLTINNGTITGGNGGYDKRGGGFHVSGGSVTVNQVTISENTASWGGGVYLSGGSFTMNDSHLDGNHSVTDGNGWHDGGGAYLDGGVFTINGGSVKDNTVTEGKRNGLLLAGSSATLNISGDVVIYDNLDGNQQENLFADAIFGGSSPLNIVGPLGPNAKIGISASLGQVLTSSPNPEYNDPTKFVSDNSDYAVCKNADGQLFLGILVSSVEVTEIDAPVVGEALDTTAATATPNVTLGELSWTPTATTAAYATVYTATVIATASANAVFTDDVTATVNGEEATVTKNTDGTLSISWTFEKTPLEPIEITAEDKEVTYSPEGFDVPVEGMFTIPETAGTASYTVIEGSGEGSYDAQTGKLTVTKSGTFTVTVNTEATDTHAAAAASATLTVNPASVTLTANSGTETYDGTEKTVTGFTASVEGLSFADVNASGSGTNAGDYDVSFSGVTLNETKDSSGNYVITAVTPGKLTVNPKAATVVADAKSKTYGAADPELTATVDGTVGADTLNYTLSRAEGENVGDYEITVTLGENPNYAITTDTATFTISKKAATITAENKSKTYGDADPELTAVVEGLIENESLNYTLSRVPGENVGEYEITVTLGENPNYEITTTGATFTITKRAATLTADDKTKTYGDADPELTATAEGVVEGDTLNYTLSRAEGENVGEYEIAVTLGENPNYEITTATGKLTVTRKAATVTADDLSKVFGEADPELTATVVGAVGEETLNYTVTRAPGEDAGEYAITVTLGENPNYDVTVGEDGVFTIDPAQVEVLIVGHNSTVVYDRETHTVRGYDFEADDERYLETYFSFSGNAVAERKNAGTTQMGLSEEQFTNNNANFAVTFTVIDGWQKIEPKLVENPFYVIGGGAQYYDGTEKRPGIKVFDDDTLVPSSEYTVSYSENVNAGTAIITVQNVDGNYVVNGETSFVILPKNASINPGEKGKMYGDNDPMLSAIVSGVVNGDTLDYTLNRTAGENAGEYLIYVTVGENPNYNLTTRTAVFTIFPKAAIVTPNDASKLYGAADPELTATVEGLVGNDTLNYSLSRTPGENVGQYEISVTLGQNPNYEVAVETGVFTIGTKEITITPNAASKTYGDADPVLTAVVEGTTEPIAYELVRATGENAGEYEITVVLGDNPNYAITTGTATFTIDPKAVSVEANDASKVYGDADPELTATVTGLVGNDTLNYTLARTEGENVGEYEITVTLGENPNYDVTASNGTFTITKKAATVTAVDKSKVYGDADPEFAATVEGLVGTDTLNYTLTRTEGENVGEYEITVTLGENPNYDVTAANGTFTITKKAATVTAVDATKVYGDADPELTATVTGLIGEDTLNYTLARAEGENVGEYEITVTLGENPNYDVTATNGTFTITKKAATVTAVDATKVYGDTDPELTATVTGLVGNDTLNYTLTRTEGENVGEYEITVTLGENPNYDVTASNGTFTITKKAVSINVADKSKVYGTNDPVLTATVSGLVNDDTLAYTLVRAEGENVGVYAITAVLGQNPNYDVTVNEGKLTIVKKTVTVKADAKTKVYGDADPALTATVTGLVGNDTLNYTLVRAEGENVGAYAVTVTLAENPNYDVSAENGTLTITQKAATLTIENLSKVYGAEDPELSAAVEGLIGEDTLDYTLSRAAGENVGDYAIKAVLGSNPNYNVTVLNATFRITKKAATITLENASKVYGDPDPVLPATVTGLVGEDTLNYTLTRAAGENVGEYKINMTLGENRNYDVTVIVGIATFTITPKAASVTANDAAKVYGETDPELTATVEGLVEGDSLNYTLSRAEGENVGEYAITVTLGENPNYDVTASNGTFTITKKAAAVKANDATKVYGETDPELTATVEGLIGDDSLNYTLTRAEGEDVGEYEITVILGENPNYDVTAINATFTITEAADECQITFFTDIDEYPHGTDEHSAIEWAYLNGITAGTGDGTTFEPATIVSRAQAMVFLYAAEGCPEFEEPDAKFTDVKKKDWFYTAVMWAVANGITGGTGDGTTFSPEKACTRSEILQFFYAAEGKPAYTIANPYSDVKNSHWYKDSAIWAYENGLERGENGKFKAKTDCTRLSTVLYIYRYITGNARVE